MMKRKIAALILTIAMVAMLGGVSACGNGEENGEIDPPATDDDTAVDDDTPADTDDDEDMLYSAQGVPLVNQEMTIELWDIATNEPTKTTQEEAVARFTEAYPHITVNQTHIQNDTYKERLVVAMSADQAPDMYIHWGGGPMNEYIDSGFGSPITDLFNEYCQVPFLEAAIEQSSYNGEIYAIPFGGLAGAGIFYNKTIFNEVGVDVPETVGELEEISETLLEAGYTPFALANATKWTGSMYYMYLATRYDGLEPFNNAVSGEGSFEHEAFVFAGDTIRDWVERGFFPEGVNSLSPDDGQDRELMYREDAAMMLHGSWQAREMASDNQEWYLENIDYFAFPALEGSAADPGIVVGTSIGNGMSFNMNDKPDMLNYGFVMMTEHYNDETYNETQLSNNTIPSIEGMGDAIEDHVTQNIWNDFSSAPSVQLWYDQFLPPLVAERHKDTSQELFGLTLTSEEVNESMQEAMEEYRSQN